MLSGSRLNRRRFLASAAATAGALTVLPRGARAGGTSSTLDDIVRAAMQATGTPGVAVAAILGDQVITGGWGVISVDDPRPVSTRTPFQIGSISKTFTGAMIMQYVERGEIALDEPVVRYLPEFQLPDPDATRQVTMRNLLTHTSGMITNDWGAGTDDGALRRWLPTMRERPLVLPVGIAPSYSNPGISVVGRALEVLSGRVFEQHTAEAIFEPLGMSGAFFPFGDGSQPGTTRGHGIFDGQPKVLSPWLLARTANPSGGIMATIDDMVRYARMWLDGGRGVLTPAGFAEMIRIQASQPPGDIQFGLVWSWQTRSPRYIGHDGGTIGFAARLHVYLDAGTALVVLTNSDSGGGVLAAVTSWFERDVLGQTRVAPSRATITPADEDLAAYPGRYENPGEMAYEVRRSGTGITLTPVYLDPLFLSITPSSIDPVVDAPGDEFEAPGTFAVAFGERDVFFPPENPGARGSFFRNADGSIAGLFTSGRFYKRV